MGDAVAIAADGCAEVGCVGQPPVERVVAVGDIGDLAGLVGDFEADEDGTVFGDLRNHAVLVGECEERDFTAVFELTVCFH